LHVDHDVPIYVVLHVLPKIYKKIKKYIFYLKTNSKSEGNELLLKSKRLKGNGGFLQARRM